MTNSQTDCLILGAGVTGLAASMELNEWAVTIEKEMRPGGLVKTHCFNDHYWFDHVLHILHFKDDAVQDKIQSLMEGILQPCRPIAWIECKEGTALYPFQLNLGSLKKAARDQCLIDYAKVYFSAAEYQEKLNYRQYLEYSFGTAMCDIFYFPYNEKLYKYPLENIVADAVIWNLHKPSFDEILAGILNPGKARETYNTNAFYPRPPINAPVRGMEVLTRSLASRAGNLQLGSEVNYIDVKSHTVHFLQNGTNRKIIYRAGCLSTIPLPGLMHLCSNVPGGLLKKVDLLSHIKVISVALSIKGERPANTGHWRYYTDPEFPFTRLIFMTSFDPDNAPQDGWGLLAEITWPGKENIDYGKLMLDTIAAITRLGYLNCSQEIIGRHFWTVDPAYAIFTPETNGIVNDCFEFLGRYGITAAGRYGSWEYSSMYQNIKKGYDWAKKITQKIQA